MKRAILPTSILIRREEDDGAGIVEDVEGGLSRRGAARKYRVSPAAVIKIVQKYNKTGCYEPLPRGGDRRSGLKAHADFIQCVVEQNKSITLVEMQKQIKEHLDMDVHISVIDRFLRGFLGYRYKKNRASLGTPP